MKSVSTWPSKSKHGSVVVRHEWVWKFSWHMCCTNKFSTKLSIDHATHVCWWHLQYRSHESVVLCESKCYKKIPAHEREQCHELIMEWFSVFETKCPVIHVKHMRNKRDEIRHCCNVLNWNINTCTNFSMISLCRTMERDTVKPLFISVSSVNENFMPRNIYSDIAWFTKPVCIVVKLLWSINATKQPARLSPRKRP